MSKIGKTMAESDRKLGELILYISRESVEDPNFGSTKLNKILYFSDFLAYGNLGKAITGAEYQHLDHGPAPRRIKPVRDGLVESRALSFEARVTSFGYRQNRTIALRNPDLSIFEADEIKLVDEVMMALSNSNAVEASEISHRQVGWKSTKLGESIPYESIFVSDEPLSPAEIRFAQSKWARQHRQSSAEAHEFQMRTIVYSNNLARQLAQWKINYARFDEAFADAERQLRICPELFPVVPGTTLRRVKLIPFKGVPALSIFFTFDDNEVVLHFAAEIDDEL